MKRTTTSRRKRWFFARAMHRAYREMLEKTRRDRSGTKKAATQRALFAEALEPRVLFSGTPAPVEEVNDADQNQEAAQTAELLDSVITTDATADGIPDAGFADGLDLGELEEAEVERLAKEAVARWEASGLTEEQAAALAEIEYVIDDLGGNTLGYVDGMTVYLDDDGAGLDWFVDDTEWLDEEFVEIDGLFRAALGEDGDSRIDAGQGVDLLSVIMHEQGHIVGLLDDYTGENPNDIMHGFFVEGERRIIDEARAEGAIAGSLEGLHRAGITVTYNFDTGAGDDGGDLNGWTDVIGTSFPGQQVFRADTAGGRGTSGLAVGTGNHDGAHPSLIMRSPEFALDPATASVSFQINGGQGDTNASQQPASPSDVPANSNGNVNNVQALALRRVSDDAYLILGNRNGNGTSYQTVNFTNAQLVSAGVTTNEIYTLDWIDSYSGGWGFAAVDDVVINGAVFNDLPVIGELEGDELAYSNPGGTGPVKIDQGTLATVTDGDTPANLDGGHLNVAFTSGSTGDDNLSFDTTAFTISGSNVEIFGSGTVIGTIPAGSDGVGGNPLQVDFNSNATVAIAQDLVRSVTFENNNAAAVGLRTVSFTVNDGIDVGAATTASVAVGGGSADTLVWDGNNDGDGNGVDWNDPLNWNGDVVPDFNDTAIFNGTDVDDLNVTVGGTLQVGTIQFDTAGYTIDGTGTLSVLEIDHTTGSNVISAQIDSPNFSGTVSTGSLEVSNASNSIAGGTWTVEAGATLKAGTDETNSALGNANVTLNDGTLSVFASGLPTPDPATIAGLEAWYDASTLAGTLSDGDQVTAWADQSGNNRDLVTGSGTATFEDNEIGGNPAVRFNANNEYLEMGAANDYFAKDVYLVFRAGNGDRTLFGPDWGAPIGVKNGPDGDRTWMFQGNEDRFWNQELPSSVRRNGVDIPSANNFDMSSTAGNNAMGEYMVLRVVAGPNNGTQVRDYIIGNRTDAWANARFDTAEVLAFNTELNATDRDTVELYLFNKYGIGTTTEANLPNSITATGTSTIEVESGFTANLGDLTVAAGSTINIEGTANFSSTELAGDTTINLVNNANVNLGAISETAAANLTFSGSGTVTMDNASSYTGTTTVESGVQVNASDGDAFGTDAAGTTVDSGGTINFTGGTYTESFNISGNGFGSGDSQAEGAIKKSLGSNVTFQGLITVDGNARIYSSGNEMSIDGGINVNGNTLTLDSQNRINIRSTSLTGGGLVRVEGSDRVDVENSNTAYSGDFELFSDGILDLHANNALGDHNGTTTVVGSEATVYLRNGRSHKSDFAIEGNGRGTLGAIFNDNNNNTIDGSVTLTGDARIFVNNNSSSSVTITGDVTGNHTLEKVGVGKLILGSASNNYGLLDWVQGNLQVKDDSGLGSTTTEISLVSGRTLEFNPDSDITSSQLDTLSFDGGTLSVLANQVTIDAGTSVALGLTSDLLIDGDGDLVLPQVIGNPAISTLSVTTDLEFWLDANDIDGDGNSGNNPVDGATVTSWVDKSGNNRNMEGFEGTPTFETNEVNALSAVRFDQNGENLQMVDPSNEFFAHDTFLVFRAGGNRTTFGPDWGAPIGVKSGPDGDRTWMLRGGDDRFWSNEIPAAVRRNGVDIPSSNEFDMSSASGNASMGEYMVLKVTAGPNNGTQVREYIVGNRTDGWANSLFDTAEVIAYDRVLSDSETREVESYLLGKYSIGDPLINNVVKSGGGTLTLGGDNIFNGTVTINDGTVVAAHDNAFGLTDGGDIAMTSSSAAVGFSGGVDITGEDITGAGTVVNADGTNSYTGDISGAGMTVISTAGELTINGTIDLGDSDVTFEGAGDVIVNSDISGNVVAGAGVPDLGGVTSNLEVWYDASDIDGNGASGDNPADGATVTAWADKSGNNRDLIGWTGSPTFETDQIGGLPAVRFNASNENLQMADPANKYFANDVFLVFRAGQDGNGSSRTTFGPDWGAPIGVKDASTADRMWMLQGNQDRFWDSELPSAVNRNGVDISSANNFDLSESNTSMGQYMVLNVTAGPNSGTQLREYIIGTRTDQWANARFDTAEVIAFSSALSTSDRDKVQSYLADKYSISGNFSVSFSNDITKTGTGTVTLTGNNTHTGEVTVSEGTLVVASDSALGSTGAETTVADGGTLALDNSIVDLADDGDDTNNSTNITLNGEAITLNGTGASGQPGALVNAAGDNTILGAPITAELIAAPLVDQIGEVGIGSVSDLLTIDTTVDLQASRLTVDGAGDVTISGEISGSGTDLTPIPVALNTMDTLPTGTYSITADGQTFDARVEQHDGNGWLLVGSGRNGWDFDAAGDEVSDPGTVKDGIGTNAAFAPRAFDSAIINDLLTQSGVSVNDIEVRFERAGDINGNDYQDLRWRNLTNTGDVWTWDLDNSAAYDNDVIYEVVDGGGAPGATVGVSNNKNTRDMSIAGNDGDRLFTFEHGGAIGFRYGNSVNNGQNNSTAFLFENGNEQHAIGYTEVYIRLENTAPPVSLLSANDLTKTGSGILTLGGANTFDGDTTVMAGALLVNNTTGSATGTGDVSVESGATFGGVTSTSATVTVEDGGSIAPGDGTGTTESLAVGSGGTVTLNDTSIASFEIGGVTAGADTGGYDQLVVDGTLNLGGATLDVSTVGGYTLTGGESFVLVKNNGGTVNGAFENAAGTIYAEGDSVTINGNDYRLTYTGGDGNDIELIGNQPAVPDAGGPYTIGAGADLQLDASGTTDPNAGDILTYKWDLDQDGNAEFTTLNAVDTAEWQTHLQNLTGGGSLGVGTHTIDLIVNDGTVDSVVDSATLTISANADVTLPPADNTADSFTVRLNGAQDTLEVVDGGGTVVRTIPRTGVTSFTFNGTSDEDTFTVDFGNGDLQIPIFINGNDPTTNPGDGLVIDNANFTTITHNHTGADSGNITFSGTSTTIIYTGLEPVDMTGSTATDFVFNLPTGADTATLTDNGGGSFTLNAATFESTTFNTASADTVTINGGAGDSVTLDAATTNLTFDLNITAEDVSLPNAIDLGGNTLTLDISGTGSSGGAITGSGGSIVKEGVGTMTFNSDLDYTGTTTVDGGILQLNQGVGFPGGGTTGQFGSAHTVTVNDGGTLQLISDWVMGDGIQNKVVVTENGTLSFLNSDNYLSNIELTGGSIETSGGNRPWRTGNWGPGVITVNSSATPSTISGSLAFVGSGAGPTTTFDVAAGAELNVSSVIFDHPGFEGRMELVKAGEGTLTLSGTNTFSGGTTLSDGDIFVTNNSALGTGAVQLGDAATGGNDISLYLDTNRTSIANTITVSNLATGDVTLGSNSSVGGSADNNQFTSIVLERDVIFNSNASDRTDYENISGTGDVTVTGNGRSIFATANTFVGDLTVATTGNPTGLQLGANSGAFNAIPDATDVTVNAGAVLSLSYTNGGSETINRLSGSGTIQNNGGFSNTLIVGSNDGSSTFDGVIQNGGGTIGLTKTGMGELQVTGESTYTGRTTVDDGTLSITNGGTIYAGSFIVAGNDWLTINDGATLDLETWAYDQGNPSTQSLGGLRTNSYAMLIDGGTVRMNGTTSSNRGFTVGANGATFEAAAGADWTLEIENASTPAVTNGNPITLTGAGTGRLDKTIGGTGSLTKEGTGTWILNGDLNHTGATTVDAGIVQLNQSGVAFPGGGSTGQFGSAHTVTVNDGGTLELTQSWVMGDGVQNKVVVNENGKLSFLNSDNYLSNIELTGGSVTTSGGNIPWRTGNFGPGLITVNSSATTSTISGRLGFVGSGAGPTTTFDVAAGAELDVSAVIFDHPGFEGRMELVKAGEGTLTLSGTNTFSGGTTLSDGDIFVTNNSALGTGAVQLGDAATGGNDISLYLDTNRTSIANTITVSNLATGDVTLGSNSSVGGSADNNQFTSIVLERDVIFNSNASDRTDYENISGTGDVTVTGNGRSIFATANTFVGDLTVATTGNPTGLQLGANSGAFNAIPDATDVTVNAGAVLSLSYTNGGSETINRLSGSGTIQNNGGFSNTLIVGSNDGSSTFDGVIQNGGGTIGLTKTGMGELQVTGESTYTGRTTVDDGTLSITNGGTIYAGSFIVAGTNWLTVNDGATLDLETWAYDQGNPSTQSLGGLRTNSYAMLIDGGTVRMNGTTSSNRGFTVGANGATFESAAGADWTLEIENANTAAVTNDNPITLTGAGMGSFEKTLGGAGSLTKEGTGTWTLTANSTYSGGTTVSEGTVLITNSNALGTGAVTLGDTNTSTSDVALLASHSGGDLVLSNDVTISSDGTGTATVGGQHSGGRAFFDGLLTLNRDVTFWGSGNDRTQFRGGITGTGDVTIDGGSRVTWSTSTTAINDGDGSSVYDFDGSVTITGNTLLQTNSNFTTGAQSLATKDFTIDAGSTLRLAYDTDVTIDELSGGGVVEALAPSGFPDPSILTVGADNGTATYTGTLIDNGRVLALVKEGAGTQTLTGANTYTGGTTINNGRLSVTDSNALGTGTVTIDGGTLRTSVNLANDITLENNAGNTIEANGFYRELSGQISGAGGFTLASGGGTPGLALSNTSNDFMGDVTVNSGTFLRLLQSEVIADTVDIINNGNLRLDVAGGGTETIDGLTGTGSIWIPTSNDNNHLLVVGADDASSAYNGTIGQSGQNNSFLALKKTGTGTFTLTNANSFGAGTTLSNGNIFVTNSSALGTGSVQLGDANTGGNDISLYLDTNRTSIGNAITVSSLATGTVTLGSNSNIGGAADNNQFTSIVLERDVIFDSNASDRTDYENISGTGDITVTGSGRSIFQTANTFDGDLTVATTGTPTGLQLGANSGAFDAIPDGTDVTVNAGAVLSLSYTNGGSETIDELTGSGTIQNNGGFSNTLIVGSDNGDANFDGVIQNGGGTIGLTKIGTGTQTLTGASTYTGNTLVSAGILSVTNTTGSATGTSNELTLGTETSLIGTGSTDSEVNVEDGAFIAPGLLPGEIEDLGSGDLNLEAGSTYTADLSGAASDTIIANGDVVIAGDLDIAFGGTAITPGTVFTLIGNTGGTTSGQFNGLAEGNIISLESGGVPTTLLRISYAGGSGNDVTLTASDATATTDIKFVGTTLTLEDIAGNDTEDNLSIRVEGGALVITDLDGNTLGTLINGAVQTEFNEIRFTPGTGAGEVDFTDIVINTGNEADSITIGDLGAGVLPGNITVTGGDGQDRIVYTGKGSVLGGTGAVEFTAEEIDFYVFSDLTTTDGDITATATGGTGNQQGIHLYGADLTTGTGNVTLDGDGGDAGNSNHGVHITNGSDITTAGGNIDIDGLGGGTGTSVSSKGVLIHFGSALTTTGGGAITIDGTAGTGSLQNEGVFILGADLTVADGNMTINGTGSGTLGGDGIVMTGTDLAATGTGNIAITGTSLTTGGSNNQGLQLTNTTIDTSAAAGGTITLSGTGSSASVSNNEGIKFSNVDIISGDGAAIDIDGVGGGTGTGLNNTGVALLTGSTVIAGGAGTVNIDGTAGSGTLMNRGVYITGVGSEVKSTSGAITINGTGNGTLSLNRGIETGFATIETAGAINMEGTGSTAASGTFNTGIYLAYSTLNSTAGTSTLIGNGGTGSSFNEGVRLLGGTVLGDLILTGTANPGTTGVFNSGVYILGTSMGTATGTITGVGGGGLGFNHGIFFRPLGIAFGGSTAGTAGSGATSVDVF